MLPAVEILGSSVATSVGDNVDTITIVGAASLLGALFRYWFRENRRTGENVWEIADEYRVERDHARAETAHWQARWLDLLQPDAGTVIPEIPDLAAMKVAARREKEHPRGRRHP